MFICRGNTRALCYFLRLCDSHTRYPLLLPKRPRTPRWERRLPHQFVVALTPSTNSLDITIEVETTDTNVKCATKALVDCGATGLFMDTQWAQDISTRSLTHPIPVYNVDGSPNETGPITEVADVILRYADHAERPLRCYPAGSTECQA